jgi:prophage antirepressor-like protein|nr:MAG TPA: repressor domain protein [Caudoviricetes sp.]DAW04859.1 MAG TPA: repressor domain protein [Caudoviricetes sp.]
MKKSQLMLKIQNSIEVFENPIFGQIRMVMVDDEPMFCLIDVCRALEIKNATDVAKRLDEDELTRLNLGGRAGESNFITESGLYAVIVRSDKPNAKKFRKWVTSDVLPTIRKTGGYVNNDELFISTYLPYADENTKLIFSQTLKTVREQNETIKRQKKEIIHKEDVIIGLVDDIDLATKRQRITQIVRFGADGKYQERYSLLYGEFERKYHCNLKSRMEGCTLKPKVRNKMDYIDREMGMIPQLYEIACKLFENDVEKLKSEWESVVA